MIIDPPPARQLLTTQEAADYLSIPRPTIYYLVKKGKLPAIKIGGRYRLDKETLDAGVLKYIQPNRVVALALTSLTAGQWSDIAEELGADNREAIFPNKHTTAEDLAAATERATHIILSLSDLDPVSRFTGKHLIVMMAEDDVLTENDLAPLSGFKVTYHFI